MGAFSASAYAASSGFCLPVFARRFLLSGFCLLVSAFSLLCFLCLFVAKCFCASLWLKSVADAGALCGFFFEIDVLQSQCHVGVHVEGAVFARQ